MRIVFIVYFITSSLLLTSCLEPVELNVDSQTSNLVMDAELNDSTFNATFSITNPEGSNLSVEGPFLLSTTNFFLNAQLDTICNCYRAEGNFSGSGTYRLAFLYNGELIEVQDTKNSAPSSLNITLLNSTNQVERRNLAIVFRDPMDTVNYYRAFVEVNREALRPSIIRIFRDNAFDGQLGIHNLNERINDGDTVVVTLQSISRDYFLYLSTLRQLQETGNLAGTVSGNPNSNLPEEILGYFATVSSISDTLIVREQPVSGNH